MAARQARNQGALFSPVKCSLRSPAHPAPPRPCAPPPAGEHPDRLPTPARLESVTGLPAAALSQTEGSVRQLLEGDTAAISAVRVLKLFLERLGADFSSPAALRCAAGPALGLITEAVCAPELLGRQPSLLAAAALMAARQAEGGLLGQGRLRRGAGAGRRAAGRAGGGKQQLCSGPLCSVPAPPWNHASLARRPGACVPLTRPAHPPCRPYHPHPPINKARPTHHLPTAPARPPLQASRPSGPRRCWR